MWDLLERWKRLTAEEKDAILSEDWNRLQQRQNDKQLLQASVVERLDRGDSELDSEGLRSEWARLMSAEQGNADLLQSKMNETQVTLDTMGRTSKQLGQIRHAYRPAGQSYWESYS